MTMSTLKVLKTCLPQQKALLAALGAIDPSDSNLMTFDLNNGEPKIPLTIAFHIPISIQNLIVHQCIIDKWESTWVMSMLVWHKLRSPLLHLSTTTLRAYDGHSTKAQGILPHIPISLASKMVLINIEVVNAQLDYNLLLGRSYVYAMRSMVSIVFRLMMFPHDRNIVMVDQLSTFHRGQPHHPMLSLLLILPLTVWLPPYCCN